MKRVIYMIPFIMLFSFSSRQIGTHCKLISITSASELQINGTSNVKDFKCAYNIQNLKIPVKIHYQTFKDVIKFENTLLVLENTGFDCGGRRINQDFHGLLKSEAYPEIRLKLKEVILNSLKDNTATALIEIQIAGISKSYHMESEYHYDSDWNISGKLKLNIQDFSLEAPKKMLGLVVVSDTIEISFNLLLKETH